MKVPFFREARKLVIFVVGASVIVVGAVMLVVPGPGTVVIPAGLAILATEFIWARRLLKRVKKAATDAVNSITGANGKPPDGK